MGVGLTGQPPDPRVRILDFVFVQNRLLTSDVVVLFSHRRVRMTQHRRHIIELKAPLLGKQSEALAVQVRAQGLSDAQLFADPLQLPLQLPVHGRVMQHR